MTFIDYKEIGYVNENDKLCYSVYKVGLDNYHLYFLLMNSNKRMDTLKSCYLNDASYENLKLSIESENKDSIIVKSNYPFLASKEVFKYNKSSKSLYIFNQRDM
jgi:hypothetical protein